MVEKLDDLLPPKAKRIGSWLVRGVVLFFLAIVAWPYLPKYYGSADLPPEHFPVLVADKYGSPTIVAYRDLSPGSTLWRTAAAGKASFKKLVFSYSVQPEPDGGMQIKLERSDPDHFVVADYVVREHRVIPQRLHQMDPGIAVALATIALLGGILLAIKLLVFRLWRRALSKRIGLEQP